MENQEVWIVFESEHLKDYSVSNWGNVRNPDGKPMKGSIFLSEQDIPYHRVKIYGRKHFVHRLVLTAFKSQEYSPDRPFCDHIDGNSLNNHVNNLRWASNRQNQYNALWSTSAEGYKGVSYDATNNLWYAGIKIDGKWKRKSFKYLYDALEYRKMMVEEHYDLNFYKFG